MRNVHPTFQSILRAHGAPDGGTASAGGAIFDDGSDVCGRCCEEFPPFTVRYFDETSESWCPHCIEAYLEDGE